METSTSIAPWAEQLIKAEPKFLSITDKERTKSELGFAAQIFQNSEALQKCEPASILNAVINVARTGITLNPVMKLAYLIPRDGKCVLDFSYMGLIKMLKDNQCITYIDSFCVYEDEKENFKYDLSLGQITHIPIFAKTEEEQNKRILYCAYSRAILPDKTVVYCFMPAWEINKVKNKSKSLNSNYSAWKTWESEMIKKTVIRRHFKLLISGQMKDELVAAMETEQTANPVVESKNTVVDIFEDENKI